MALLVPAACGCLIMIMLLLCRVAAVEHVVGDAAFGWDSGINYAAWARERTFAVGDVLVFQYVSSQHNLYEVTQSSYRSCDVGDNGGVLATYTSGNDRVLLAEPRSYWFICQFPGHCLGGMKVAVNVSAGGGGASGGALSPANAPPGSSASAAAPLTVGGWLAMGLALAVLQFMNRAIK